MAVLSIAKVVGALPGTLAPDTIYAVRAGEGFDLYVSDATGSVAHRINYPAQAGVPLGRWEGSAVSALTADNVFDDALYSHYTIVGQLRPATNAVNLTATLRDSTPADVAGGIIAGAHWANMTAAGASGGNTTALQGSLSSTVGVKSFEMELFTPGTSAHATHSFHWRANVYQSNSAWYSYIVQGVIGDGTPRQGIRFFFSSGNIAAGWIEIIGHPKQSA